MSFNAGYWTGFVVSLIFGVVFFLAVTDGRISFEQNYKEDLDQCKTDLSKAVEDRKCECECSSPVFDTIFIWVIAILLYAHAFYIHHTANKRLRDIELGQQKKGRT